MATIRVANVTVQIMFSPTVHTRSVSDTISWVEEPFRRQVRVSNVTFQALMPGEPRIRGNGLDELDLEQIVTFFNVVGDRQVPENELEFEQVALSTNFPYVEQTIVWTEVANTNLYNRNVHHPLGLWGAAQACFGAPWGGVSVSDTLELTQSANRAHPHTATNTLSFVQVVDRVQGGTEQFLELEQTVSAGFGYEASNELEFTQTLQSESDFLRSVSHTSIISQAFTYYIDNSCNQKSYAKFDGEGTGPGLDEKRLTWDGDFVLETVGAETKTTLSLRSPETDDRDRYGFNRINRETRGGELHVYGDPEWSKVNTLLFTIVALTDGQGDCPDKINDLMDFFQDTLGEQIQLHDWTGVTWKGVVTTPNETATEDAEGYWTITFEFEGIALPGSSSDQPLLMTDSATRIMIFNRPLTDAISWTEDAHAGGDIRVEVGQTLELSEEMGGTQEIVILDHTFSGTGNLDGESPDTGTETWRAHTDFEVDGTQTAGVEAGAYYPITLSDGTVYECTWKAFNEATANDSDSIIAGFYENISASNTITGDTANGTIDPTTLKTGHLRRQVSGSPLNGYRIGNDHDGMYDTKDWTDATLKTTSDNALDLRITIDTTGGAGNWTAHWEAKSTISSNYTEVGPETDLPNESIGAVGWSNESVDTDMSIDRITLLELRSV